MAQRCRKSLFTHAKNLEKGKAIKYNNNVNKTGDAVINIKKVV